MNYIHQFNNTQAVNNYIENNYSEPFLALTNNGDLYFNRKKANANGHEYVDLGLPSGNLWSTCNLGATTPEEYGDYYAWGEIETKNEYSWSNYKFGSDYNNLTKYNSTDHKTILDLEDDVAHVEWGGDWVIPTNADFEELISNCVWTQVIISGDSIGYNVTSIKNGNSIFICKNGAFVDYQAGPQAAGGNYWCSKQTTSYKSGDILTFQQDGSFDVYINARERYIGHGIRPVLKPTIKSVYDITNGHEYVDLKLPSGNLWATCNIGASSPEQIGDLFAWGEIQPKETYSWDNYRFGTENNLTKYNSTDGKTRLDSEDDAAHILWKGKWCIPTADDIVEILHKCSFERLENGALISSYNNSIFIPNATDYSSNDLYGRLDYKEAYGTYMFAESEHLDRFNGFSIRPVLKLL